MVTRFDSNKSINERSKCLKLFSFKCFDLPFLNNCDMNEFIKNEIDICVYSETLDFFKLFNLDKSFFKNHL